MCRRPPSAPTGRCRSTGPGRTRCPWPRSSSRHVHEARIPAAAVEGWSIDASWRGLRLLDVVERAGGNANSHVAVVSFGAGGIRRSQIFGPQLSAALLATHLNGQRLSLDQGYPLRLMAPNRPELLNTKWVSQIEVL